MPLSPGKLKPPWRRCFQWESPRLRSSGPPPGHPARRATILPWYHSDRNANGGHCAELLLRLVARDRRISDNPVAEPPSIAPLPEAPIKPTLSSGHVCHMCATVFVSGGIMARKTGQVIRRGSSTWLCSATQEMHCARLWNSALPTNRDRSLKFPSVVIPGVACEEVPT